MAEREGERAHDPQAIGEVDDRGGLLRDGRCPRGLEGQDLDLLLRPLAVEHVTVQIRAVAASRRPLFLRSEVVDEAELDVAHRRPLRDRDREGKEANPALGVQRAVDRVEHDPRRTAAAELQLAALLRDEHAVDRGGLEAAEDRRFRRGVDGGRLVAPLAGADDGLAIGAGGELEPVSQAGGTAGPT